MTSFPEKNPDKERALAIGLMLGSILLFSVVTALVKFMTADVSVFTITFFRNLFAFLPSALVLLALQPEFFRQRPTGVKRYWARAISGVASMLCLFQAYHLLPLADVTAVYFCGPLLISLLAVVILREKLNARRMLALAAGFCGVLVIARPENLGFGAGLVFALGGTAFYAVSMILIRSLGKTEDPFVMSFYFSLFATILSALLLPFEWQALTMMQVLMLALIGFIAFVAQTCMNKAYKHMEASHLAPFIYTSLLWNALFGFLIWAEQPTLYTLAGAALIIGANLMISMKFKKARPAPV